MTMQSPSHSDFEAGHPFVLEPTNAGKPRELATVLLQLQSEQATQVEVKLPIVQEKDVARDSCDAVASVDHQASGKRR